MAANTIEVPMLAGQTSIFGSFVVRGTDGNYAGTYPDTDTAINYAAHIGGTVTDDTNGQTVYPTAQTSRDVEAGYGTPALPHGQQELTGAASTAADDATGQTARRGFLAGGEDAGITAMAKAAPQAPANSAAALSPAAVISPAASKPRVTVLNAEDIIVDRRELPPMPPAIIDGVLRRGGKLLLSGKSKTGKSFGLIELAAAIATGSAWMGIPCAQGRALYVNLELQREEAHARVCDVIHALGVDDAAAQANLKIVNARGMFVDIKDLVDSLVASFRRGSYDLVIIDPAYKVLNGSQNDDAVVTAFCAELDRLSAALDTSIAYCHHAGKGSQAGRDPEDRPSGSGVWARDADAVLDLTEVEDVDAAVDVRTRLGLSAAAVPLRLDGVLRSFSAAGLKREVWYDYPRHYLDDGILAGARPRLAGERRPRAQATEQAILNVMGDRDEMPRSEALEAAGIRDKRSLESRLRGSEVLEIVASANRAVVRRK